MKYKKKKNSIMEMELLIFMLEIKNMLKLKVKEA